MPYSFASESTPLTVKSLSNKNSSVKFLIIISCCKNFILSNRGQNHCCVGCNGTTKEDYCVKLQRYISQNTSLLLAPHNRFLYFRLAEERFKEAINEAATLQQRSDGNRMSELSSGRNVYFLSKFISENLKVEKSKVMRKYGSLLFFCLLTVWLQAQKKNDFIQVHDGIFYEGKTPYYYIGANYWYGGILASTGEGGDRARLEKELDLFQKCGINNLRILVGAEGPDNEPSRVTPTLQTAPGKYNDTLLDGLDFLLAELKKRDIRAVLYLGNSWEWSGGYAQYLNWNGYGTIPYPNLPQYSWPDFLKYVNEFHKSCDVCKEQFSDYVEFILSRTNRYTNVKYVDDPTIMTWEIANEPRAFSKENFPSFEKWIKDTAALIKSLDSNHLVTTGTEGQWGCEGSMEVFEKIHADSNVDYLTMHIWPKNWGWLDPNDIAGTIDKSIKLTNEYMDNHVAIAKKLNKPLVLEEFGLPRDHHTYSLDDKTVNRDKYYENAFGIVSKNAEEKGHLAGCNFWAFGGTARPVKGQAFWKKGDDLMGDPPQEEQGLNSVFDRDSTMKLIKKYTQHLTKLSKGK